MCTATVPHERTVSNKLAQTCNTVITDIIDYRTVVSITQSWWHHMELSLASDPKLCRCTDTLQVTHSPSRQLPAPCTTVARAAGARSGAHRDSGSPSSVAKP